MKTIFGILKIIILLVLLLGAAALYFTYGERSLLTVKKVSFSSANGSEASGTQTNLRVVQFSDTHVGEYFSQQQLMRVVEKINAQQPDIVIFTGDLFDNAANLTTAQRAAVFEALGGVEANISKLAIYGNRDIGGGASRFYADSMQKAGFTVLQDTIARFDVNGKTVTVGGADDFLLGAPIPQTLTEQLNEADYNILAVHEPDGYLPYTDAPYNLALSGHSHGGQVILPFYGAVTKTAMCETYFKGMYNIENARGTRLYVSSGIGNTRVPFRFGNIPQIVRFDIIL